MSVPKSHLIVTPKVIQAVVLCLAVVALAFYFGFEVKKIVAPPQIQLTSPTDGMVTAERRITVEGRTEREVALTVNGKQVSPDGGGTFRDSLDLQEGLNVITIVGTKKYSREMIVTRRVIVTPKQKPTATVLPPEPSL